MARELSARVSGKTEAELKTAHSPQLSETLSFFLRKFHTPVSDNAQPNKLMTVLSGHNCVNIFVNHKREITENSTV